MNKALTTVIVIVIASAWLTILLQQSRLARQAAEISEWKSTAQIAIHSRNVYWRRDPSPQDLRDALDASKPMNPTMSGYMRK